VLLASGRPSYNIKLDWQLLRGNPVANDVILTLIRAVTDEGLTYNDTFPVTRNTPFEFVPNMTNAQRNRLDAYFDFHNIDPDIDVSDFLAWMRNHYRIDYTVGILDARLIMGVRYELEVRAIVGTIPSYIFAADVGTELISYLNERNLLGVFIESTYVREYHTPHAPHMIGYVGAMTAEEFEYFRHLGYPMDALVGKIGAELAFESYLHGRNGLEIIRMTEDGTVLSHEIVNPPQPGNHIYLTLDIGLQRATENALQTQINLINRERMDGEEEEALITGGAVVVVDVNTGEVLAAASYPMFNLSTLAEDWGTLQADPTLPMFNRVLHGRYVPGSTFKMVTALAGLRYRHIGRYTTILDRGMYDRWAEQGFTASCWIYRQFGVTHGHVDVVQAIGVSCNYFFLHIADGFYINQYRGAYALAGISQEFGLGRSTGIELNEAIGHLATPSVKRELLGVNWVPADTLLAGFGQGLNRFTPLQLATYTATIANGGTLNALSILSRIYSPEFDVLHSHEIEVLHVIPETHFIEMIQEGMVHTSRGPGGTGRPVFEHFEPLVASKTGTVQIAEGRINDGLFVAYAPAHNPEIAIAVVVEQGGSGSAIMDIARMIFEYYFAFESSITVTPYGQMVP